MGRGKETKEQVEKIEEDRQEENRMMRKWGVEKKQKDKWER